MFKLKKKGIKPWKWKMPKDKKETMLTKEDFNKAKEALEKANVKGPFTVTTPNGTYTIY